MKIIFHTDPGHGWLAVPIERLAELGIRDDITGYSYYSSEISYAFLEEDVDAGTFIEAATAAGWELDIIEDNEPTNNSFIRALAPYPWAQTQPKHELSGATMACRLTS